VEGCVDVGEVEGVAWYGLEGVLGGVEFAASTPLRMERPGLGVSLVGIRTSAVML
jgi:hypothetical protein